MSSKHTGALSTYQIESCSMDGTADKVYGLFKDLSFDSMCPSEVSSVRIVKGQRGLVGSIVEFNQRDGQKMTWHIVEISDYNRTIMLELIDSEPTLKTACILHWIKVFKDTITNNSFVRWETNFSNDADLEEITRVKNMKMEAMRSISKMMTGEQPPHLKKMPQNVDTEFRGVLNVEQLSG